MKTSHQLALIFGNINITAFNYFPLRPSWISAYPTINSKILCQKELGHRWRGENKMHLCHNVTKFGSAAVRGQKGVALQFRDAVQIDGVVALSKKRQGIQKKVQRMGSSYN
jgi:hypothetical protein